MEHACHLAGDEEQAQNLAAVAECEEGHEGAARNRPQSAPSGRATQTFVNVRSQLRQKTGEEKGIGIRTLALRGRGVATDTSPDSLLGTWKWSHPPRWIMSEQKVARRKEAAAVWRAPAVSTFMPTGGRNLWSGARVSTGSQAFYLKPRTINRHHLLHPSKAPPYPGVDYLWTPGSLLATGVPACDVGDWALWSKHTTFH